MRYRNRRLAIVPLVTLLAIAKLAPAPYVQSAEAGIDDAIYRLRGVKLDPGAPREEATQI